MYLYTSILYENVVLLYEKETLHVTTRFYQELKST